MPPIFRYGGIKMVYPILLTASPSPEPWFYTISQSFSVNFNYSGSIVISKKENF
jgi:hypothetical protein